MYHFLLFVFRFSICFVFHPLSCLLLDGLHFLKSLSPSSHYFVSLFYLVTSENRTCTSHLPKSKVTQSHSCLQEHRRFLSLWLTCCHCVVLFLSLCLTP